MAQTLSDLSAELKLKAANLLATGFEVWKPGPTSALTKVLADLAPDTETRDAAILALNAYAQNKGKSYADWEHYEINVLRFVMLQAPPMIGLDIIKFLTRPAG